MPDEPKRTADYKQVNTFHELLKAFSKICILKTNCFNTNVVKNTYKWMRVVTYLFLFKKFEVLFSRRIDWGPFIRWDLAMFWCYSERGLLVGFLNPAPSGNIQWQWSLSCHEVYRCCPTFFAPTLPVVYMARQCKHSPTGWYTEKNKTYPVMCLGS